LLADANQYLLALRRAGDLDAGGLVVCVDCDHADLVARFMEQRVLGSRPVVACSRLHDPGIPRRQTPSEDSAMATILGWLQ